MAVCIGCGLEVVDGLLQVDLAAGGGITCGGDGLAVTFPAAYSPTRSPDACNCLEVRENGLWARCPKALASVHQWVGTEIAPLTVSSAAGGDDPALGFNWESSMATITNDTGCEVRGRLSARAGGPVLAMNDGFRGYADVQVDFGLGGGWQNAIPATTIYCENSQGAVIRIGLNNFLDENYLAIGPGATQTYKARIHLVVTAGTAAASGIPAVEINWILAQVCC